MNHRLEGESRTEAPPHHGLSRRAVMMGAAAMGCLAGPLSDVPAQGSTVWRQLPERYLQPSGGIGAPVSPNHLGIMVPGPEGIPLAKLKDGRTVIHPTQLGNLLNQHLDSYEIDGDRAHVTFVARVADAMAQRATTRQGAIFLAYEFENTLGGHNLPNPWYSSMGQAKFPSVYHRLYRHTGVRKWLGYRQAVLQAFRLPPVRTQPALPWIAGVDINNCLWLEEAPEPAGHFTTVFNGHFFAFSELANYQRISGDAAVTDLVQGGAATLDYYRNLCRQPGQYSNYYASIQSAIPSYHPIHMNMYRALWDGCGARRFGITADLMVRDHPVSSGKGTLRVLPGPNQIMKFTTKPGVPQVWKTTTPLALSSSTRTSWPGFPGVWSYMNTGPHAGMFIKEGPYAYRTGLMTDRVPYVRAREVTFPANVPIIAREWNADGTFRIVRRFTLSTPSMAHSKQRAKLGGRHQIQILDGSLAGLWLEEGTVHFR